MLHRSGLDRRLFQGLACGFFRSDCLSDTDFILAFDDDLIIFIDAAFNDGIDAIGRTELDRLLLDLAIDDDIKHISVQELYQCLGRYQDTALGDFCIRNDRRIHPRYEQVIRICICAFIVSCPPVRPGLIWTILPVS